MAGAPTAQGTHTRRLPALLDLLRRTVAEARADGERRLAAETTYYAFFSLFPLMMILVSALDAVVSRKTRDEIVDSLIGQFPVIGDDIAASVATPQGRGLAAAVGLAPRPVGRVARLRVLRSTRSPSSGRDRPSPRRAC